MVFNPSDQLKQFFATSKPTFFNKGDIVLRPGDLHSSAFFLKKGYIKDSTVSSDGREFILFIFQPTDLFSYSWIFTQTPNEHSFKAMTDCVVYEKSREELLLFFERNPKILFMITQKLVRRMGGLMVRMEDLAFHSALKKLGSILLILSERFGRKNKAGIVIPIPLTQQDIANLIGISRETTSIELNKLIDLGFVKRSFGLYVISDPKKLQKYIQL